nr:PBP1A family penicillin-binding protein [Oceanococcus sp. HetDA_MAG_MS8]
MARFLKPLLLAGVAMGLLALLAVAAVLLYFSRDLPPVEQAQELQLHQPLRVLARDGTVIGEFGAERREPLAWEDVPPVLVDAFLAAEDDRFFEHPGVDYQGLLRAVWVLIATGEKAQGGSTITMQLARNLFLSNEKSYERKIREILLAFRLEQRFAKTEILRLYLNKIFLGQRAYGVAAAARIYYGKAVDELSLAEAAMIAGLPKAPSAYNPVANPRRAELRRNYVLRRMRELGRITEQEELAAKAVPVKQALAASDISLDAQYVAEMARAELVQRYGTAVYTSGVNVYTTIDASLQRAAAEAVRAGVLSYDARHAWRGAPGRTELPTNLDAQRILGASLDTRMAWATQWLEDMPDVAGLEAALVVAVSPQTDEQAHQWHVLDAQGELHALIADQIPWSTARQDLRPGDWAYLRGSESDVQLAQAPQAQSALIAMSPQTGAIRALVGGYDYFLSKFNRAVQAKRQPGSSFKPLLYSAALESGLTTATVMNDAPVVFDDPALGGAWRPENYDGRFRGPTRLREALVRSSNLISIRVLQRVGIAEFRDYAQKFGLDAQNLPRDLSIALGSGTFSPQDIAKAYSVIANQGFVVEPWFIERVETADGAVVEVAQVLKACPECEEAPQAAANSLENPPGEPVAEVAVDDASIEAAAEPAGLPSQPQFSPAPRALEAANMFIVGDMMRDVIQRGTGRKARALGRKDIAGKTGTTNEQRDAWFAGFHPDLVAVTWIGFDDLTPLGRGETGGRAALPIWMDFMAQALPGLPPKEFLPPPGVVIARIDPETGLLASDGREEMFLEGKLPDQAPRKNGPAAAATSSSPEEDAAEELLDELF